MAQNLFCTRPFVAATKPIPANKSDPCRKPFLIEFDIKRRLTGPRRKQDWSKALKVKPVKDNYDRWDLQVRFPRGKTTYHRLVCLATVPCVELLIKGRQVSVDPFMVPKRHLAAFEANHMNEDPRDCRRRNLEPLPVKLHKMISRR